MGADAVLIVRDVVAHNVVGNGGGFLLGLSDEGVNI